MSTLFCQSNALSLVDSSSASTAPAANLTSSYPGMVWRSPNLTAPYVVAKVTGRFDTIALVKNNLRSFDTIRYRYANTAQGTIDAPTDDLTFNAWDGVAPQNGALSLFMPPSRQNGFVRLDFSSTGNSDGFVQAQRLVIGRRFENPGLDIGFERTMEDTSVIEAGPVDAVTPYNVRVGWKVSLSGIKEADYETFWHPFALAVGNSRDFLFVEDTNPAYLQNRAAMCRMVSSAKGSAVASDYWTIDAQLKSTS